jgi:hypothetical protein
VQIHITHFGGLLQGENQLCWNVVGTEKHAYNSRLHSVYMAAEEKAENNADCQKDNSAVTYSCSVFHFIGRFVQETSGAVSNLIYV